MRKLFLTTATALVLALTFAATVAGSTYDEIKLHGGVMRDQLNQVRSPNATGKYFLYSHADGRAQAAVDEYARTGVADFQHEPGLDKIEAKLDSLGVCYHWVGENIGRAFLRTSPAAATADDIMDMWEASPTHNSLMKDPSVDWTGGAFVESHWPGYYFFAMYVVDVCGI